MKAVDGKVRCHMAGEEKEDDEGLPGCSCANLEPDFFFLLEKADDLEQVASLWISRWAQHPHQALGRVVRGNTKVTCSQELGAGHCIFSAACSIRASVVSRPRTSSVSNRGGAFLRPQTATRIG